MTTEQRIKQIAEDLRALYNSDNDAPRLIHEYLHDMCPDPENIRRIEELEEEVAELKSLEEE